MKIVIDIPNDMIKSLEQGSFGAKYNMYDLVGCVMNGIPLEEHCNNCETGNPCLYCKHSFEERGERDEASD